MIQNKKTAAYLGLVFVILLWGTSPLITLYFYKFYSPTMRVAFGSLTSGLAMLLIAHKRLGELSRRYFKPAIPTGICLGICVLCVCQISSEPVPRSVSSVPRREGLWMGNSPSERL